MIEVTEYTHVRIKAVILKLQHTPGSLEGIVITDGQTPEFLIQQIWVEGWARVPNKFPDAIDAAGPKTTG